MTTAYLAVEGLEAQLEEELRRRDVAVTLRHGRLLVSDGPAVPSA